MAAVPVTAAVDRVAHTSIRRRTGPEDQIDVSIAVDFFSECTRSIARSLSRPFAVTAAVDRGAHASIRRRTGPEDQIDVSIAVDFFGMHTTSIGDLLTPPEVRSVCEEARQ
jgi:hypothetical protein